MGSLRTRTNPSRSPDHVAEGADHVHYPENGTGMRCGTSTRQDPEDSGIEWNVRGVDAADFEISSAGVLTFIDVARLREPDGQRAST